MGLFASRRRGGRALADLESRVVWIFGSPRSGSTWLLALLTHPLAPEDFAPLGAERRESAVAEAPEAVPINEPYLAQHLAPALPDEQLMNPALPAVNLYELRRETSSYFLADRYEAAWRPLLRELVLTRLHAQAAEIATAHRLHNPLIVVKEPNGSLGAAFVTSLLPRSRLVFLLRDGRDVVDSMVDALAPGGWLAGSDTLSPEQRSALVRHESQLWLERTRAAQRAYAAHAPGLRRLVRYEDARADPERVLTELDAWLEVARTAEGRADAMRWNDFDAYPAEAKGAGKPLRAAASGLWRENLTAEEQAIMTEVMGAKLTELGYG